MVFLWYIIPGKQTSSKLLPQTQFLLISQAQKKTQQVPPPSLYRSVILLISGTPSVGEQFLKLKGVFVLFFTAAEK